MSKFRPEWLALREPADAAARSSQLAGQVASHLASRSSVVHVLDLATGTGANMRYLASRLPQPQEWLLVDNDPQVLATVRSDANPAVSWKTECVNLAGNLGAYQRLFADRELVTASALLDLVSGAWVDQ